MAKFSNKVLTDAEKAGVTPPSLSYIPQPSIFTSHWSHTGILPNGTIVPYSDSGSDNSDY
jgi:hypothetical protein